MKEKKDFEHIYPNNVIYDFQNRKKRLRRNRQKDKNLKTSLPTFQKTNPKKKGKEQLATRRSECLKKVIEFTWKLCLQLRAHSHQAKATVKAKDIKEQAAKRKKDTWQTSKWFFAFSFSVAWCEYALKVNAIN